MGTASRVRLGSTCTEDTEGIHGIRSACSAFLTRPRSLTWRCSRAALFVGYASASRGLDMRDVDLKDMFCKQVEGIGPRDMRMMGAPSVSRHLRRRGRRFGTPVRGVTKSLTTGPLQTTVGPLQSSSAIQASAISAGR
jgi:hypothetical protein